MDRNGPKWTVITEMDIEMSNFFPGLSLGTPCLTATPTTASVEKKWILAGILYHRGASVHADLKIAIYEICRYYIINDMKYGLDIYISESNLAKFQE